MNSSFPDPVRELDRKRADRAYAETTERAAEAERHGREARSAQAARQEFEDVHADTLQQSATRARVVVGVVTVGVLSFLGLDYTSLGAISDYFATLTFADWPNVRLAARLLFPMVYAGLDVAVGWSLDRARTNRLAVRTDLLTALACLLVAAPAAFVIVTHLADAMVTGGGGGLVGGLAAAFRWKLLGTLAVALVPHAAMIAGSMWAAESIECLTVHRAHRTLMAREEQSREASRLNEIEAVKALVRYRELHFRLNADAAAPEPFPPFDLAVNEIAERRLRVACIPGLAAWPQGDSLTAPERRH